jgi:hypothetical protein
MTEERQSSAVSFPYRRLFAAALLIVAMLACSASSSAADKQGPLHVRIDAVVDASRTGAETPLCADADFIRRVYLDLVGVIPTSTEAKAFLDDVAKDKRQKLIDRLLTDPRFDRHMQITFDVMLMERRPAKYVTQPEWVQYLYTSFSENKPLDQLAREILSADGSDEKQRAAARFYLDREVEPNLVTRDVGRMFLGRDMQCAQCHDHPLIDDYYQNDYYGIFAFLNRGSLFTDPKKKVLYAEKAEGDLVDFKSVFTGAAGKTGPHLPGVAVIDEPQFEKGEEYVVKPAKDVRPIPKFSRRERLAEELTGGKFRAFQRNLANRLWGHMLGRGIVEPYDVDHSANPPSQPELLELLTDELVAAKFDTRFFLREIALSKTYQRASSLLDQTIPDGWSQKFFVAEIEPLTPEQMALSAMQATGLLEEYRLAAETAERAKLEKEKKTVADDELARHVENAVFAKAQGDINNFVNVLGQGSGPGATAYQSTVQEALFLTNATQVSAWMKPKAGNLADRLLKLSEPAALAEELYLSVLTRQPGEDELAAVAQYLTGRDKDRSTAIEEMIWGLLSSAEFRFHH